MNDYYYFTYQQIHQTIQQVSQKIVNSEFDPDLILAIGGGGFIPARILRTFINKPIITVAISYYDANNKLMIAPKKHQWLEGIEVTGKRILLVDEVDDSRVTLEFCIKELLEHNPAEVAVFVLHKKNKSKLGQIPKQIKHYFVGQELEDKWIRYPWDAIDINEHDKYANAK